MRKKLSKIEIRLAELRDLKSINEIGQNVYLDIPRFTWGQPRWNHNMVNAGRYWVATENDVVVGIICLEEYSVVLMLISVLAVAKTHQKSGIGKKLIEFAKKRAKKIGKKQLHVGSFLEYNALDFYLKCGFNKYDRLGSFQEHEFHSFYLDL